MSRSHKYKWVGELKPKAKFIHIGWTNTLSFYPRYSLWLYLYTILLSLVLFTLVEPIPYPPILIPFTLVEPIPYPILGSIHIGWTYTLSYPWFYSHWLNLYPILSLFLFTLVEPIPYPILSSVHIGWTNILSYPCFYSHWLNLYPILSLVLFTLVEHIPYPILGSIHIGWTYILSYPWFYSHWLYLISGILLSHVHPIEWCDVCVIVYYIYTIQAYTLNLVIYFSVSM